MLEPAHFLGRDAAHVVPDDSAPWPHGTAVTFEASEAPHAVRAFLETAARHYPLPVTIGGEVVERRAFLDGALHVEPWKGLVFGVFKDSHAGYRVPDVNFHGLTLPVRLPQIDAVEGGRLAAITSAHCVPGDAAWRDAFASMGGGARTVFTMAIDGRAYARRGTGFDTRLTVIERSAEPGIVVDGQYRAAPSSPSPSGQRPLPSPAATSSAMRSRPPRRRGSWPPSRRRRSPMTGVPWWSLPSRPAGRTPAMPLPRRLGLGDRPPLPGRRRGQPRHHHRRRRGAVRSGPVQTWLDAERRHRSG